MVQIPANIRPALSAVVKYHFWILLALVPLLALPAVVLIRGRLANEIDSARRQIEERLTAMQSVATTEPHPNEAWSAAIDKVTVRVKRETLDEWEKLWESQQTLRVWPESLGPDFLQRIAALKPGGRLPRPLLERYQNAVRAIVRTLPKRMGADESMLEQSAAGPGQPPARPGRPGAVGKPSGPVFWNPADQARVFASFNWEKPPSTTQVLLAQEELWVYGVLADAIARVNAPSAGSYTAAIPIVEQLAVGYPAAEDNPGGVGSGRIIVPVATGQAIGPGDFAPPDPGQMQAGAGAAVNRPPHPRFGGVGPGGAMPGPGGEPPADFAAAPEDLLRNWIYVDFTGKPLMAAELATSLDAKIVHLVPFVIRAVIDERKIDALLVDLASAPTPIDVRQVRIDPNGAGPGISGPPPGLPGVPAAQAGRLPTEVNVELRGTVALATFPDRRLIGLEDGNDEDEDDDDKAAAATESEQPPPAADGLAPPDTAAPPDNASPPQPAAGPAGGDQP